VRVRLVTPKVKHLRSTPGVDVAFCGARNGQGAPGLLSFVKSARQATCEVCRAHKHQAIVNRRTAPWSIP
jgi:hypothetical protein